MGFDIDGITLTSPGSNRLRITNNSNYMEIDSGGRLLLPYTPLFTAGGTGSAYEYKTAASWNTITWNSVLNNVGSHFNGTTGRFTAPIAGAYLFTLCGYSYTSTAAALTYMHPTFLVNSSWTSRRGNGSTAYRIRHYGYADQYFDCEMSEIFSLQASDYVEVYIYYNVATIGMYSNYKLFTGVFLG